jgi:hypothetical protein
MSANESHRSGEADQEDYRRQLAEAEARYHDALREYTAAVDLRMGDEALALAEERKRTARAEYHRILRIFSDMVVRGKRPKP